MSINEHTHYLHGNLGREWQMKVIDSVGKVVYENALAYQLKKDDPTIWVNLTIWEDSRDGSTALAETIADQTGKGSRVMIRGKFSQSSYKNKEGEMKTSWNCNVWDVANVIKPKQDDWGGRTAIVDSDSEHWGDARKEAKEMPF